VPALTLLDGVSWRGRAIPGDRVAALLAALAIVAGAAPFVRARRAVRSTITEGNPA